MNKYIKTFFIMSLLVLLVACSNKEQEQSTAKESDFYGAWHGEVYFQERNLPIQIRINKESAAITLPTKDIYDEPYTSMKIEGNHLVATIMLNGKEVKTEGDLAKDRIEGTYSYGEKERTFYLVRGELGFDEKIVDVAVADGHLETLYTVPEDDKKVPLYVIVAGSGPTDRDGNTALGKNNSYAMLASELIDEDIATVRYDKRGVETNKALVKDEADLRFGDYVKDVVAIVDDARASDKYTSVGIIGHSEGALIATEAAQHTDVDSLILLAGAGRPIGEVITEQLKPQVDEAILQQASDIMTKLKNGEEVGEVNAALQPLFRKSVQGYMASWLALDPQKSIAAVNSDTPILLVSGTHDLQVSEMDAKLLQVAKPEAELVTIDGMNHILKDAPSDVQLNLATYTNSKLPISYDLIKALTAFSNK